MTQEKPLDQIDDSELAKYWNNRISKILVGRTITKVEYMSQTDAEEQDWCNRPIQIQLDNKIWLTPTSDDEGNEGGSIHTNLKKDHIIPTL